MLSINNATPPNCGEALKSSDTTFNGKLLKGPQVMPVANGKKSEELGDLQPSF